MREQFHSKEKKRGGKRNMAKKMTKRERLINLMRASIRSPKTPPHLKKGLRKKLKSMGVKP